MSALEQSLEKLTRHAMSSGAAMFAEKAAKGEIDKSAPLMDAFGDFPAEFLTIRRDLTEPITDALKRDTIDHAAEAVIALNNAGEYPFGHDDDERREQYHLAEAQVHATLYAAEQTAALVEQQRLNTLAILYTAPGGEFRIDWVRKQLDKGLGL